MIANSSTRRMQIAVSSNICGFLLLCLGSGSLVSTIVVLVGTCSASVVVTLASSAVIWDPFSWGICDPNVLPAPHFFWSASSGGSGSSSRLVCWQCGQVQSLDLVHKGPLAFFLCENLDNNNHREANLFLSPAGYSMDPTPTAACPFRGKKPWRPIIAKRNAIRWGCEDYQQRNSPVRTPHAGCQSSSWSTIRC